MKTPKLTKAQMATLLGDMERHSAAERAKILDDPKSIAVAVRDRNARIVKAGQRAAADLSTTAVAFNRAADGVGKLADAMIAIAPAQPVRIAWIRVYRYGGRYTARAQGTGDRASRIKSELEAVRQCALKVATRLGAELTAENKVGYSTWEATAILPALSSRPSRLGVRTPNEARA